MAINDRARDSDVRLQSHALLLRSGGKEQVMKKLLRVTEGVLFVALSFIPAVLPTITFAQTDKSVKEDVKDAGHSTKEATKKTGRKIKRGTKKVVNKSSTKTVEGANKVADKTKE